MSTSATDPGDPVVEPPTLPPPPEPRRSDRGDATDRGTVTDRRTVPTSAAGSAHRRSHVPHPRPRVRLTAVRSAGELNTAWQIVRRRGLDRLRSSPTPPSGRRATRSVSAPGGSAHEPNHATDRRASCFRSCGASRSACCAVYNVRRLPGSSVVGVGARCRRRPCPTVSRSTGLAAIEFPSRSCSLVSAAAFTGRYRLVSADAVPSSRVRQPSTLTARRPVRYRHGRARHLDTTPDSVHGTIQRPGRTPRS